jgi:hypothetical protein
MRLKSPQSSQHQAPLQVGEKYALAAVSDEPPSGLEDSGKRSDFQPVMGILPYSSNINSGSGILLSYGHCNSPSAKNNAWKYSGCSRNIFEQMSYSPTTLCINFSR